MTRGKAMMNSTKHHLTAPMISALGAVAFLCSLGASLALTVSRAPAQEAKPRAPAEAQCDAPFRPEAWTSADFDRTAIDPAKTKMIPSHKLLQSDYATLGVLDGWIEGLADDSPSGNRIAECRQQFEPQLEDECYASQDIIIQRTSGAEGKVVALRLDAPSCPSPACRSLVQCVHDVWKDRPAPFPEAYKGDVIATNAGMHFYNPSYLRPSAARPGEAIPYSAYHAALEEAARTVEKQLAVLKQSPRPDEDGWRHSMRFHEAWATDIQVVLAVRAEN